MNENNAQPGDTENHQASGWKGEPVLTQAVYEELRRIARAQMDQLAPGQTLQPTALVHEAYLRLARGAGLEWSNERHFIATIARTMRYFLVDEARRKARPKHGGDRRRVLIEDGEASENPPLRLLALHEATRHLEQADPRKGRILDLRMFGGLTLDQIATTLGVSIDTVKCDWRFIKPWVAARLSDDEDATPRRDP